MKIIFLDIDGVLNCRNSKPSCHGIMGIDDDKAQNLKYIVENTNADIVLISSWRTGWEKIHKERQGYMADYLDGKLEKAGLSIIDKTDNRTAMRGEAIINWLSDKNIESFVILDDEEHDYKKHGLTDRLVKTEFYNDMGGLQRAESEQAIAILRNSKIKRGYIK